MIELETRDEGSPAGPQHPIGRLHPSTATLLVSLFAALLLGAIMLLLPLPYAAVSTGPTTDTLAEHEGTPLISISGTTTYPTQGSLDLTTVRIYGGPRSRVSPWQMVTAWLDREQAVVPEGAIFPPGQSAEQATEENRLEMASSQQSATAAALRALGHEVTEEVRVAGFSAASPSEGELRKGDVIVSVEGAPTSDGETLRDALQQVTPGKPAEMVVRRDGSDLTVSPMTRKNDSGATALGIVVEPVFVFPFQVEIQIDNVGGSSAGTMFALGIIDKLTPGALTGGLTFAGTGTITADGAVGPIGFIQQKMYGARDAGARYFLAPRENCDEVAGYEPDGLSVIAVSTLTEARAAVEQIGSGKGEAGLPRCG